MRVWEIVCTDFSQSRVTLFCLFLFWIPPPLSNWVAVCVWQRECVGESACSCEVEGKDQDDCGPATRLLLHWTQGWSGQKGECLLLLRDPVLNRASFQGTLKGSRGRGERSTCVGRGHWVYSHRHHRYLAERLEFSTSVHIRTSLSHDASLWGSEWNRKRVRGVKCSGHFTFCFIMRFKLTLLSGTCQAAHGSASTWVCKRWLTGVPLWSWCRRSEVWR